MGVERELMLSEHLATPLVEGGIRDDGTILIDVIRPCIGRGQGRHVYEAKMLEEHAGIFRGWKMFVDHMDPKAKRSGPRSPYDLGGRIIESYWDGDVPADPERGFGQGAVRGVVLPTEFVEKLVSRDPEILGTSINAEATAVRREVRDGKPALVVEGIKSQPQGSVDWVTEAGAGGRVVEIRESVFADPNAEEAAVLVEMDDEELLEKLRAEQVARLSETETAPPPGDPAGSGKEDDPMDVKALREALESDPEVKSYLGTLIQEAVSTGVQEQVTLLAPRLRAEARAEAFREVELRDLREAAHKQIDGAKLPDKLAARVKSRFELVEGRPTPELDVYEELGSDNEITKPVAEVLAESVKAMLDEAREVLAEANPTVVTGLGGGAGSGEQGAPAAGKEKKRGALVDAMLSEAQFPEQVRERIWEVPSSG